ncbi:MAG: acylphosphatase [Planctomycetes bacterium]|nr:acylphosphatase [Planctomycetota bacterium]
MSEQKPPNIRRTVYFTGRVQGVGFRYTACEVARSFGVVGVVKNLPDGRVQMVAEGEPGEVSRFQAAVADAMGGRISDVAGQDSPATGEFLSFSIAY